MNINKRFLRVPKSPPRKIMMDLQKERLIRTGTIPHSSDEAKSKTSKAVVKRRVRNSRKGKKQVSSYIGTLRAEPPCLTSRASTFTY